MIPAYRAPIDAQGHMANEGDWATLVDATLRLANFSGANVTIELPNGKKYAATIDNGGVTFGVVERTGLHLVPGGAA